MTARNQSWLTQEGPQYSQSGFTLIELLIALTLFGLLSVALVGGLRFGTRVWESGHERSAAFFEVEAVRGFLRNQLSQARIMQPFRGAQDSNSTFSGTSERIQFVAPLPDYVGLGGLYRFELTQSQTENGRDLVLEWELYRTDLARPNNEETTSRRILLPNIESLGIRYYGAPTPSAEAEWRDTWDGTTHLPLLIALDLGFPESDVRTWPSFIVAPYAATVEARR